MNRTILGWLAIAATVVLLPVLKWSHLGVLNYNLFLTIMLGWTLGLIAWFRWLGPDAGLTQDKDIGGEMDDDD